MLVSPHIRAERIGAYFESTTNLKRLQILLLTLSMLPYTYGVVRLYLPTYTPIDSSVRGRNDLVYIYCVSNGIKATRVFRRLCLNFPPRLNEGLGRM